MIHNLLGKYIYNSQITFEVLVKVLMSVGPGEDLNFLKKEFEEFLKGLICLPIKFPGTRLYKSLKVTIINEKNKTKKHNTNASALGFHIITNVYACS